MVIYLVAFVTVALLRSILVEWLQLGASGIAIMGVVTSLIAGSSTITHAHAMGMRLKREQVYMLVRSLQAFVLAGASTYLVIQAIGANAIIPLPAGGAYALILAGYALLFRGQFRPMIVESGVWSS